MVLCNLQFISLKNGVSIGSFLAKLRRSGIKPVVQARIIRWMILPTQISIGYLLGRNIHWDLLLILGETDSIPHEAQLDIDSTWSASSGVSSKAISNYEAVNAELLHPPPRSVKPPGKHTVKPSRTSQNLEMSTELEEWIAALPTPLKEHPVSMLNLLAFNPGKKDQYKQYGAEFSAKVGSKHGGRVKIVGRVVGGQAHRDGWEEIAFVHYPSVQHFASMAGSKDYQDANHKYRLGALKDTFICCVMEVDDNGNPTNIRSIKEKL
ncbi:hypothetical protein F4813DRAFT_186808 [Daldinia decipiens]|uniref:uncharacterized protein n=1 Tax=Daldinia decipiens TaxID=326647 RepID=UPI0020C23D03|nr:uncharacterized protein F4813DRAFT_186808 [Daldinia decipiens]KAI1655008.1 hypothetical protein F4813DRAFT_186808 [Daldinia decipiens]